MIFNIWVVGGGGTRRKGDGVYVCVCVCVFAGALNLSLYGSKSFNHICSVLTFTVETTLLKVLNVFSI